VYLKLESNNQIASLIGDFNQFLEQHQLLSTYKINPFLTHYPLHNTLYLTNYEKKQIPAIINAVKAIANGQQSFMVSSDQFIASPSAYLMLSAKQSAQLNALSNLTLNFLAPLRDKDAKIPAWAAADPSRRYLFKQYGSPNVKTNYHPHFTIFDPIHLSKQQRQTLYQQLTVLIKQFSEKHPNAAQARAYAIGVGVADEQGQIIKELAVFELKK